MQTTRHLVTVLVEFATSMQFGQCDFSGTAFGFVLVIHLDARRNTATVICHADGVIAVDGDDDIVTVTG